MSKLIPLCIAVFLLSGCEKPFQYEQAAVEAVSFVGIPDSDVLLDPANQVITVAIPPVLSNGLQPVLKLTKNTQVFDGLRADKTVDMTPFCSCAQSGGPKEALIRVANDMSVTAYKLRVRAKGELKAVSGTEKLLFSRQTQRLTLMLPVENLYSNPRITQVEFTNLATGAVISARTDGNCVPQCNPNSLNQLAVELSSPISTVLTPGTYSIRLGESTLISFTQQLLVVD